MTRRKYARRSYQDAMEQHILTHPRCAVWGTPGVGKTVTTLTALQMLYMTSLAAPTLIVATLRVARRTWAVECAKWKHLEGLEVIPIVGSLKDRLLAVQTEGLVFTINYENLEWLIEYWGDRWPYRVVVADEATKLKSIRLSYRRRQRRDGTLGPEFLAGGGGARAQALGRLAHLHIERFIELTGTPSPNGLKDLWGQLWFLDRGHRLGRTFTAFSDRWFYPARDGRGMSPKDHADGEIHRLVADLCLSVDARDYFPLEDPVVVPIRVQLPAAAMRTYKTMERQMFLEIGDRQVSAANAAVRTQKCLQLANGAVYLDPDEEVENPLARKEWREVHTAKLDALVSLIEELNGATLIVVYEFWSDQERLTKALKPYGARVFKTDQDETDFKEGRIPVLLVHPQSGGHGIDGFQDVCHHMAFFGHNWNLEYYLQIVERIGPTRQYQSGFERNVFLYFLIADDTMDEEVMLRRESKREVQDLLMEATSRRNAGLPSAWSMEQTALEML